MGGLDAISGAVGGISLGEVGRLPGLPMIIGPPLRRGRWHRCFNPVGPGIIIWKRFQIIPQ
jgi:hypothetical protein